MSALSCAVALVLLMDASGSITPEDYRVQRDATAAAIESPAVVNRIDPERPIALHARIFDNESVESVPWRIIRTASDARAFAAAMRADPRVPAGSTNIGGAVDDAVAALEAAPCAPDQAVIDVTTDGVSHAGQSELARDAAAERGVRINALGVRPGPEEDGTRGPLPGPWLRAHLITPDGFAMDAEDWSVFARAILAKISMEIAAR